MVVGSDDSRLRLWYNDFHPAPSLPTSSGSLHPSQLVQLHIFINFLKSVFKNI